MAKAWLSVSDPAEFGSLRNWLGHVPGLEVRLQPSVPVAGELGAGDLRWFLPRALGCLPSLSARCLSSSGLGAATLPSQ